MADYAHPEVLVTTDWVLENKDKDGIKIVESNEDILLYEVSHIEGAIKLDWETELQDSLVRDYVNQENFGALLSSKGMIQFNNTCLENGLVTFDNAFKCLTILPGEEYA